MFKLRFIIFCFAFLFATNLFADLAPSNKVSIDGNISVPSIKFDDEKALFTSTKAYKPTFGVGIMYKSLRLGLSTFEKGIRYTATFHFFRDSVVSPYLGLSYINGSKVKYFMSQAGEFKMDHTDYLIGLSGNIPLLNFSGKMSANIHPYVEYELLSSVFMVGVRISLSYNFDKL